MVQTVANSNFGIGSPLDGQNYIESITKLASGGFVAVFSQQNGVAPIIAQIFDQSGQAVGDRFQLASGGVGPVLTGLPSGGFAAAWTNFSSGRQVQVATFDSTGNALGTPATLSNTYLWCRDCQCHSNDQRQFRCGLEPNEPRHPYSFGIYADGGWWRYAAGYCDSYLHDALS